MITKMLKMSVNNVNRSHSTIPQHITHTPPMEKTEGFRVISQLI